MPAISSLTNRIFIACTLLAMLSLGFAFYFVNARAMSEAEAELRRSLIEAGILVDQNRAGVTDTLTRLARLVADLPKLKAAVETSDPPTVQPLADEYREQVKADVLLLTGRRGEVLGTSGAGAFERLAPDLLWQEPAEVARAAVDAMESGSRSVTPGLTNQLAAAAWRYLPNTLRLPLQEGFTAALPRVRRQRDRSS